MSLGKRDDRLAKTTLETALCGDKTLQLPLRESVSCGVSIEILEPTKSGLYSGFSFPTETVKPLFRGGRFDQTGCTQTIRGRR